MLDKFVNRQKNAFTLAEALLTLTIIGVVASYTIPSLLGNVSNAGTAQLVLKYQSVFSSAIRYYMLDNGLSELSSSSMFSSTQENTWAAIKPYLNKVKDCELNIGQGCFASNYSYLNGGSAPNSPDNNPAGKGIGADGVSMYIALHGGTNCSTSWSNSGSGPLSRECGHFIIDVNGKKGPNVRGRDFFVWHILNNGSVLPFGTDDDIRRGCDSSSDDVEADIAGSNGTTGAPGYGDGCTAKIIRDKALNY